MKTGRSEEQAGRSTAGRGKAAASVVVPFGCSLAPRTFEATCYSQLEKRKSSAKAVKDSSGKDGEASLKK